MDPGSAATSHPNNIPQGESDPTKSVEQISVKYQEERQKRLRSDGNSQYVEILQSDKYKHFADDPWLPKNGVVPGITLQGDLKFKFVILGAGFGGILNAIRLIEAGFKPSEIVMVDSAGGLGGTWYWNRYPGLMCDVESYCYLPLLEETGYMPKHRYSYGSEILEYANLIAEKWQIAERVILRATWESLAWNDSTMEWGLQVTQQQGSEGKQIRATLHGDYVITVSGVLAYPKLPKIPGIEDFLGATFHTSRWAYNCTGGSPDDPSLTSLEGKRVGIIGTGATAVQALPHLAKYAKEVYVFQRTPSSVDERGQRPTDVTEWKSKIANESGWQAKRKRNFASFVSNDPAKGSNPDLVQDGWTDLLSYCALIGTPRDVIPTPEGIGAHIQWLYAVDVPRSERVRARVDEIVSDKETASKLKAWYPGWCKRPCFHDEYLDVFNLPHVKLIDTDGKSIDRITKDGVVANGTEYPVDILIWSTGFTSPGRGGPDSRASITMTGRNGVTMSQKFSELGFGTLHGVVSRDFPNLFFPGPSQAGVTANQMFVLDVTAEHIAYIISQAEQQKKSQDQKLLIEPTYDAEEVWTQQVMAGSAVMAGVSGCTPSYLNLEGETEKIKELPVEQQMKRARVAPWGKGLNDYLKHVEAWRKKGGMEGIEVKVF